MKKIKGDKPIGIIIHTYMEISQENSLYSYLYLKQAKMSCFSLYLVSFFSYKIGEQEGITSPAKGESWHQWEEGGDGEKGKKSKYGAIKCVHRYVNAKMIPVETTP
jgi:hypothetical protein